MQGLLDLFDEPETPSPGEEPPRIATVFNGKYTIENTGTKEHRTFWIRTQLKDAKFAPGKRVVCLLDGPNNEADYRGFAFIDDAKLSVWKRYRGLPGKKSAFEWYAVMLWELVTEGESSKWFERGYRLLVEGRCLRCNRPLTDPESLRLGEGPICRELR